MKKVGVINQPIAAVISGLGHTDTIAIADAGLPIPATTQRIDLALTTGVPSFLETLRVVLSEMFVEKAIVAEEMKTVSPQMYAALTELLGNVPIEAIPHVEFKRETAVTKAIIRTGEFTPYANVILVAGAWGFDLGD
ncbi:MAG: D-ribose pyranase [Ardenticatenaceae bacterium]|nr:D-ribose pyranase [Ardenticatenaceae bacterium]MCB9445895.1 D-ribose pyranase [Ardenticatenaceae bacterium]